VKAIFATVLGVAAAFLTVPALAKQTSSPWVLAQGPNGATEVSARSEIAAPQGSGFAVLKIIHPAGDNPEVIVNLIVEAPKRLQVFPFDKYEGPVDKTAKEFMSFDIASRDRGAIGPAKVMPNGYYSASLPGAFVFETIDKKLVRLLLGIGDGQKLTVMVNGRPNSIRVVFDTTGLKKILHRMGMKPAPR
jgi:hypothetical protein